MSVSAFSLLRRRFPHHQPPVLPAAAATVSGGHGNGRTAQSAFPPVLVALSIGWAPAWAHSLLFAARPLAVRSTYSAGRLAGGCKVQLSRAWLDRQPGNLEGREAATVDDGT